MLAHTSHTDPHTSPPLKHTHHTHSQGQTMPTNDKDSELMFSQALDDHDRRYYLQRRPIPPRPPAEFVTYNRSMTKPPQDYDAICPGCNSTITTVHCTTQGACKYQYQCKAGNCRRRTRLTKITKFKLKPTRHQHQHQHQDRRHDQAQHPDPQERRQEQRRDKPRADRPRQPPPRSRQANP